MHNKNGHFKITMHLLHKKYYDRESFVLLPLKFFSLQGSCEPSTIQV
jgi:hypothetical protein